MGLASVGKGWGYIFMQEVGLLFQHERDGASCYTGNRWSLFSAGKGWG